MMDGVRLLAAAQVAFRGSRLIAGKAKLIHTADKLVLTSLAWHGLKIALNYLYIQSS